MRLYQVQLETPYEIFSFEIGTDEYDAVEIATEFLKSAFGDYSPYHVGGYDCIGTTNKEGVVSFKRI